MTHKILVRGPVFSVSGYGEQARLALRALRDNKDLDLYVMPINWGKTGWMSSINEEREWIDSLVIKTVNYMNQGGTFDISLQVTIPNEWEKIAPINIGYTAGIETTMIAPQWIEKSRIMDKIIVVSEHSKNVFENTVYTMTNKQTGESKQIRCETPIDVIGFATREVTPDADFSLDLDYNFNFLAVSQWGPRKNMKNTVRWFLEECYDQKVGLVLKVQRMNNSIPDRHRMIDKVSSVVRAFDSSNPDLDRKCKVYVLHGDLSESQMHSLYNNPKIKALVSLTHGEGFGLPIFEAAYNGLPVIAPAWSGHLDYLYAPVKSNKKTRIKKLFESLDYNLNPIQKEAVWDGVLQKDSMWCYPTEGSYKMKLRRMKSKYKGIKKNANILRKQILKDFSEEVIYKKFSESVCSVKAGPKQNFDSGLKSVTVL